MFLALLDITLVNLYILWKLVHNGTPRMKTREEFYTALAEEMYFYSGFDPIVRTRSFEKAKTPSPPRFASLYQVRVPWSFQAVQQRCRYLFCES